MIGSIYGHASDSDDRSRLFSETLEFLNSSGLPWILLGDYNATEEDQEISPFLASGKAFSLDEDFAAEGLPIATRKDGKRRLDFGLSSRDYYATQRWQQAGLSDHDLVGYEIPIATPVDLCYLPSRRRFSSTDAQTLAFFQEHWSSLRFSETFQQQSLDQGWTMLSNFAEDALAGDNSSTGTRRSAGWTPKPKAAYHKAAKSQEPLLLRQLRRVHRRLVELIRRPHQDDLKRVLRKNIQMLQVKIPQLIGNTNANAEELATILQDAIAEKERHCIQEHRTAWKTSLQDSSIKQSQWIRRRASAVRTEVALADAESRHLWLAKATAICPQHQIQEAEQQWTEIWTKRPITDVRWNVQTALLNSVQAPSTTMPIPILTGKDLLSSCKHMQDKAAVFGPHFAQDFPACIALELLGWKQDPPQFATVWASLQRAIRYHSHPPVWLHHCGRDFASKTWQQVLPQAAGAVEQCGWNISADGSTIQRLDSHGQHRSFQLGVDNPVILFEWLRNVFRTNELKKSKRVQRSLHRQGEGAERCARGQLLPGPPPGLCLFQGHNYLFRNDHDRSIQHACLATGASFWFFNVGARLAADHPRRKCICGGSTPSRPHLVWECPATLHLRAQIGRPSHRAEERLFAKVCLEMPAPPPEDNGDIMENFIQTLTTCMDESSTPLPLATDGSTTRSQVAAWGVYLPTADQHFTGGIAGEDQSPFRAEVVAIVQTLQGLIHACRARPHLARKKHVILISDCQSALALCNDCIGSTPLLARQVQQLIRQLQSAVAKLEFLWIPSHGKLVKDTLFTSVFTEAELRKWNDVIDKAVRSKASEKAAGSNREAWWNQACVDKDWEMKVIRTVAAAHVRYQSYLMSL